MRLPVFIFWLLFLLHITFSILWCIFKIPTYPSISGILICINLLLWAQSKKYREKFVHIHKNKV